jgi:hypothetical protein
LPLRGLLYGLGQDIPAELSREQFRRPIPERVDELLFDGVPELLLKPLYDRAFDPPVEPICDSPIGLLQPNTLLSHRCLP